MILSNLREISVTFLIHLSSSIASNHKIGEEMVALILIIVDVHPCAIDTTTLKRGCGVDRFSLLSEELGVIILRTGIGFPQRTCFAGCIIHSWYILISTKNLFVSNIEF